MTTLDSRPYGPAGGDWPLRIWLAVAMTSIVFGVIVAGQTGANVGAAPHIFATILLPASCIAAAWPGVVKVAHQVTRDGARVLRFMAWWATPSVATARSNLSGTLPQLRAVAILPYILGRDRTPNVVMLPVHPEQADRIMATDRPVLIRRRSVRADVEYVALYVTAPVMRIVAIAPVAAVDAASPTWLASIYGKRMDMGRGEFGDYVDGRDTVTAVALERIYPLLEPLTVGAATGHTTARERRIEGGALEVLRGALG